MLTLSDRQDIQTEYAKGGISTAELAEMWFVSKSTIKNIVKGIKTGENDKYQKRLSTLQIKTIKEVIKGRKENTRFIKKEKRTNKQLAEKFGVHPNSITNVIRRIEEDEELNKNDALKFEDFQNV